MKTEGDKMSALKSQIITGDKFRITVLDDGLIRFEYSETNNFENKLTQLVTNRRFPPTEYSCTDSGDLIEIDTSRVHVEYDKKCFSANGLIIRIKGNITNYKQEYRYGTEVRDLGGTARTLDECNGACKLDHGIISQYGYSILDDSHSMTLTDTGEMQPRETAGIDIYFFGYGHDYREALKKFYQLCGKTPLLPKFALGNWWSRYYKYSAKTYLELMDKFEKEDIPFSVAVIDMDWHLTEIDPKYGSGWTGYTWNRDLFPDPEGFLAKLHSKGLKITLNEHPADGIRPFEDCYNQAAKAAGIQPSSEKSIKFDITDPLYIKIRNDIVLHNLEKTGVDFWWIDWQQGIYTKIQGLDPLWMLNHYTFIHEKDEGKRPLVLSRYAGPGSHRYPVGFSGDTYITWESLNFQPYFTATAANIGYGWWSHDIGGHMHGTKDNILACRWIQFGVFSPINRLHSSNCEFSGKEPWNFSDEVHSVMNKFLKLRHRMIPYLYTMNYRAYEYGEPLVQPMYYAYPDNSHAYEVPNEYLFGTELIVAPITTPQIKNLNLGKVRVWLPQGIYYDIFTGIRYTGDCVINMFRSVKSIPVLAKAGAIIPFTEQVEAKVLNKNPAELTIKVYGGADGRFILYEDDGETQDYLDDKFAETEFILDWKDSSFKIVRPQGDTKLLPQQRRYRIELYGITDSFPSVSINKQRIETNIYYDSGILHVDLPSITLLTDVELKWEKKIKLCVVDTREAIKQRINDAEIEYDTKERIFALINGVDDTCSLVKELSALNVDADLLNSMLEYLQ